MNTTKYAKGQTIRTGILLDKHGQFAPRGGEECYYEEATIEEVGFCSGPGYRYPDNRIPGVYARVVSGRNSGYAKWYEISKISTAVV